MDGVGNRWGHVGYYFGRKDTWICIDASSAEFEQLYPDGAPQIGQLTGEDVDAEAAETAGQKRESAERTDSKQESAGRIVPKPDYGVMALAAGLVLLVAGATAVLLVVLRKKGISGNAGDERG